MSFLWPFGRSKSTSSADDFDPDDFIDERSRLSPPPEDDDDDDDSLSPSPASQSGSLPSTLSSPETTAGLAPMFNAENRTLSTAIEQILLKSEDDKRSAEGRMTSAEVAALFGKGHAPRQVSSVLVEEMAAAGTPDCSVCTQAFQDDTMLNMRPLKLPCEHIMCQGCLKNMREQGDVCTICQQDLPQPPHIVFEDAVTFMLRAVNEKGRKQSNFLQEAAKLFQSAALQGDPYAQFNLGVCYEHGTGVVKNMVRAADLHRSACEQLPDERQRTQHRARARSFS